MPLKLCLDAHSINQFYENIQFNQKFGVTEAHTEAKKWIFFASERRESVSRMQPGPEILVKQCQKKAHYSKNDIFLWLEQRHEQLGLLHKASQVDA